MKRKRESKEEDEMSEYRREWMIQKKLIEKGEKEKWKNRQIDWVSENKVVKVFNW